MVNLLNKKFNESSISTTLSKIVGELSTARSKSFETDINISRRYYAKIVRIFNEIAIINRLREKE